jgi:cyclophilin family peptidyl-prolyl cis-trans isomerase
MFKRIWKTPSEASRHDAGSRAIAGRSRRRLLLEVLEGRQLLATGASLAPISNITVPALLSYQVTLDGTGTTDPSQTFTATSSNPDIKVSAATGPYWTFTVNHTAANSSDVTITNEQMTFQLFQDLTPNTVNRINGTLITNNNNYYTQGFPTQSPAVPAGQYIPRITSVSSSGFDAIQGGSSSATSTASSSGVTPIATEISPGLAFTGTNQIAMANTGSANSTDAQFFITNGGTPSASIQQAFDFNYTVFGQLVSGLQTVTDLSKVAVTTNSGGEKSQPINPVTITGAAISTQNPSGVLHVDATGAKAGETATITVTAHDPSGSGSTATQTFTVTVGPYVGPAAGSLSAATPANTPTTIQLTKGSIPATLSNFTLTYQLVGQPTNGTATVNPTTGSVVYTPKSGFSGPDTFQYQVVATGATGTTPTPVNAGTVTVQVGATPNGPTANTGAVRVIGPVLVVDPTPTGAHAINSIVLNQVPDPATGTDVIQVAVNNVLDSTQPSVANISQIVVYGNKSGNRITVEPTVTLPAMLDGGPGMGKKVVQAGAGATLEHGWYGQTLLVGGSGPNELVGRKGHVRFKPTSTTALVYVGNANPATSHRHPTPPGGTYYRYVKGHLVRVK